MQYCGLVHKSLSWETTSQIFSVYALHNLSGWMHDFSDMGIVQFRIELECISHTDISISSIILYQEKATICHIKNHL